MATESAPSLSERLRALRVEPPHAAGFEATLRARLEAEVAVARGVVKLANQRVKRNRVVTRRMGVLLSAAAILVGGSAFALVGPRILEWVGLKEPEAQAPVEPSETPHNSTLRPRGEHSSPVETVPNDASSAGASTADTNTSTAESTDSAPHLPAKPNARRTEAATTNNSVESTAAAERSAAAETVHVPKLSIDLGKKPAEVGHSSDVPGLTPIQVPRLDPERPRVLHPDTNQLRDNSLRETLRRNRAGKSD